jgi:hypothetical protein
MYFLSVWLHILAAAVWVGGLIYTAAVAVPFALTHDVPERQRLLRGLAWRFRWIGWGSIVVLFITGLGNLTLRLSPISFSQILNGDLFNPDKVEQLIAICCLGNSSRNCDDRADGFSRHHQHPGRETE